MKPLILSLLMICAMAAPGLAQNKNQGDDLKSMVETELAFSHMSEDKGTREAFAAFIAADGILFRPTAVLGKKWMQEHPLPPSPTRSLLSWQPIFAAVSGAGDLGYTTGPWQFKQDIKDTKPAAFGNFVTVWRKQADGSWKFALDLGIGNPEPKSTPLAWQPDNIQRSTKALPKADQEAARTALLNADREFSKAAADQGAREALLSYAAKDVRLFRDDHFPFVGKTAAADALTPISAEWTWKPAFAGVSVAGDLGYSYGVYELREKGGARLVSERGNYARVWKKVIGEWKLVVDVANPLPPEAKKNQARVRG
jgi:ketosteroid isomerase-like protein